MTPIGFLHEVDDLGGPAFPLHGGEWVQHGMTLRDWFAGQALAGLVASIETPDDHARHAYLIAEAMLIERLKPREAA